MPARTRFGDEFLGSWGDFTGRLYHPKSGPPGSRSPGFRPQLPVSSGGLTRVAEGVVNPVHGLSSRPPRQSGVAKLRRRAAGVDCGSRPSHVPLVTGTVPVTSHAPGGS